MGLRAKATQDAKYILENDTTGFGWPFTLTDPAGNSGSLKGNSGDIAQLIDPDTGQAVSGRLAHITVHMTSLALAGLGIPVGISDSSSKPWVCQFDDPLLNSYTFKVSSSDPDRTVGLVTCTLELYVP
jgi:hypothetical protein